MGDLLNILAVLAVIGIPSVGIIILFYKYEAEYVKNILISNKLQKKKNYYKTIGAEGFTNLLISYKGIGPWTVDMAKMFFLGDVDILPKGDLGIKRACNNFFPNETLESIEEIYKPFNSYLSLNLWDSLD